MKTRTLQIGQDALEKNLETMDNNFDIILLFSSTEILRDTDTIKKIRQTAPDATLIGCSTSGEIGLHVEDDSLSIMAMKFENSKFKCGSVAIEDAEDSYRAGKELASNLNGDDIAGIFVLLPGLGVNGSKFTKGLKEILPRTVSVSGGMAGDGLNFKETLIIYNDELATNKAIGFAVYGENVTMKTGSRGGWKPFGPQRRVTRSTNNILYEIDGKPALDLYKEYLGDKAVDLPSSGLLYPFAIMDADTSRPAGLIRTILDINEEDKSLILAGDMEVGQKVCLMHANTDELVDGATEATRHAMQDNNAREHDAMICVSCVGRKIVMGDDTEDELDAVRSEFQSPNIAGFYSYGEISIFQDTGEPELHNQTMTVTYISERT